MKRIKTLTLVEQQTLLGQFFFQAGANIAFVADQQPLESMSYIQEHIPLVAVGGGKRIAANYPLGTH